MTGQRLRGWRATAAPLAAASALWALAWPDAGAAASPPPAASSWTVYHHDLAGTGVVTSVAAVHTAKRAWTSPVLDGQLYGEPLVWAGRVYVATERDDVYALSAATGKVAWSARMGRPVPASRLPCGDITPTVGITGTPVIDRSRDEIFAVADELVHGKPAHVLVGLSAKTGRSELRRAVDPPGANPAALLQRTGLTLDQGRVVFGLGGNYGDCPNYRGRVVGVPARGGRPGYFTVDAARGESQGAVWMGGAAPVVGRGGHIWVSTGNGSVYSAGHAYDDSDGVLELSRALRLVQYFAPRDWPVNNSQDLDMSTAPVLLPGNLVLLTGKSRIVYLLNRRRLGGIGGQLATLRRACSDDIDGGFAAVGLTAYLPCLSGIIAVRARRSPASLRLLWSSGTGGGPPIVAAGLVWTIGQNGVLYGLAPASGKVRQQAPIGTPANHFPTPSVGAGLLLAPAARRVVAFRATAGRAGSPAGPATAGPSSAVGGTAGSQPSDQPAVSGGAIAGIAVAGLVLVCAVFWLARRRVGRGTGK
jgi:polyvinyl alcohol dehydrogenase (cytochrome)